MNINLTTGQLCSILKLGSAEYFKVNTPDPVSPFHRGAAPVSPTIELLVVTASDSCKVDPLDTITDGNSNVWCKFVGGRPRNLAKR